MSTPTFISCLLPRVTTHISPNFHLTNVITWALVPVVLYMSHVRWSRLHARYINDIIRQSVGVNCLQLSIPGNPGEVNKTRSSRLMLVSFIDCISASNVNFMIKNSISEYLIVFLEVGVQKLACTCACDVNWKMLHTQKESYMHIRACVNSSTEYNQLNWFIVTWLHYKIKHVEYKHKLAGINKVIHLLIIQFVHVNTCNFFFYK